jgi:hypothetical protein
MIRELLQACSVDNRRLTVAGETLASIAKSYAVDISMVSWLT